MSTAIIVALIEGGSLIIGATIRKIKEERE